MQISIEHETFPLSMYENDFRRVQRKIIIYTNEILFFPISGPDFVTSLEDGEYVYFFFREQAVEYINCGKVCTFLSYGAKIRQKCNFRKDALVCLNG